MDKVLVCLDGSEISHRALQKAVEWADTELHLVHIGPISLLDITQNHLPMGGDDLFPKQVQERLEKNGQRILDQSQDRVVKPGLKVIRHLELGHPGDKLCQLAEELKVDCVVIGSRGLNTLGRALLGSVSDFVVHNAQVPVVVVK